MVEKLSLRRRGPLNFISRNFRDIDARALDRTILYDSWTDLISTLTLSPPRASNELSLHNTYLQDTKR